jgi:Zn-dependent M28 family amino/carboxypeptidase
MENVDLGVETSVNIVAEKRGHGAGDRHVTVVTAHLDSINDRSPEVLAPAPGADDNASGCAGVLEIARVLSRHAGRGDLRLILFGGEEQGTVGSEHHVALLSQAERQRIKAVVNMDMIATVNTGNVLTVLLEGAPVSQHVIDGLATAAASHTTLVVKCSTKPGRSDHVPFIRVDIPAVLTIEGDDRANGHVHSADDTLAHINYDLLLSILRMNLAFVAKSVDR